MKFFVMDIWKDYDYTSGKENFRPSLKVYLRDGQKTRGLVLVFPGGGYTFNSDREAEPIALAYVNAGYNAAYLNYSVAPDQHPMPLQDGLRALSIIVENKEAWKIDMEKIYVIGFSAGGHLAASVSNFLHRREYYRDGINLEALHLAGSILSYPVISSNPAIAHQGSFDSLVGKSAPKNLLDLVSMEKQVHEGTPPTFIWHTVEDGSVPVENTLEYVKALTEKEVSYECHIYPFGGHGLSLATEETAMDEGGLNPHVADWMNQSIKWMKLEKK